MLEECFEPLTRSLEECRRQALTEFLSDFMDLLIEQGFTLEDLLDALANWTYQQGELEEVVKCLEQSVDLLCASEHGRTS